MGNRTDAAGSPAPVRGLRPSPSGRGLLVETANPDDPARPPGGDRWALDADVRASIGPDGVTIGSLTLPVPGERWWPLWRDGDPVVAYVRGGGLWLADRDGDERVGLPDGVVAGPGPEATVADGRLLICGAGPGGRPVTIDLPLDAARGEAAHCTPVPLTPPAQAPHPDTTTPVDPDAALLLWIRAPQSDGAAPGGMPMVLSGVPTKILDLSLSWPADARLGALDASILDGVRDAIGGLRARGHRGAIVVGGHSFGATLALYALARLPEIAAAIAHSGCYNRTRTPGGFQFERRTYWQAPEIYRAFSAFEFADRLDRPVLLIHGELDTNPATPAEEAIGLYRAVVAAGGSARLVLLPGEGHTVRFRESLETIRAEQLRWLELAGARTREPAA